MLESKAASASLNFALVRSRISLAAAFVNVTINNWSIFKSSSATYRATKEVSEKVLPVPALASSNTRC